MKVVFVRTPRYVWPFNSETSAFWQPLGFMSLAGQLEKSHSDWRVEIIDCPGSKIGWKTLLNTLSSEWPDVICIGEETVSSNEAIKLATFVKKQHPSTTVVAGGVFFSYAGQEFLKRGLIDYVVHGEGEITLLELLRAISDNCSVRNVKGVSCSLNGKIVTTPVRAPIADMDDLPMPAWSKISMQSYGFKSKNHPSLVSIEHGRGCTDSCDFCILWKHMGLTENGKNVKPYYRSKSPERSLEEVTRLVCDHNRHTFGWVDPTWNADPKWTDGFCELLLKHNINIKQTAWVRADCVVRDEKLGILEKAVRAGLCQVMIGVERPDETTLSGLNKHSNGPDITIKAFEIFRKKYPSVFTIGSVIFGTWDETKKSFNELSKYHYKVGMDYCFFIPLTPNPGTKVYEDACKHGIIEVEDFRAYNFHTPIMRTKRFSAKQLEKLYFKLAFRVSFDRFVHHFKQFLSLRNKRHRRVFKSLFKHGAKIAKKYLANRLLHPFGTKTTVYSRRPKWYMS